MALPKLKPYEQAQPLAQLALEKTLFEPRDLAGLAHDEELLEILKQARRDGKTVVLEIWVE